jgi:hypothetical protein
VNARAALLNRSIALEPERTRRRNPSGASHQASPLGALHAAAGNRAVSRAVASGIIQRFTVVPAKKQKSAYYAGTGKSLRVSDDGKLAVPDSAVFEGEKLMYATADVIASAQGALAAAESPYTLTAGSEVIRGRAPGSRTGPVLTLVRADPTDLRSGKSGSELTTIEACSGHGLDAMGVGVDASAQKQSGHKAMIDTGGGTSVRNTGSSAHVESDLTAQATILQKIAKTEKGLPLDGPDLTRAEAKSIYMNLSEKKRTAYAKQYGMNQYASPEVGEGIESMRVHTEGTKHATPTGFPMHFAPVVAKTGGDYVAMENFAKNSSERTGGDTATASKAWYFRMYGPFKEDTGEDQSYYGQHAEEGSIGGRATSMGLRNRNEGP